MGVGGGGSFILFRDGKCEVKIPSFFLNKNGSTVEFITYWETIFELKVILEPQDALASTLNLTAFSAVEEKDNIISETYFFFYLLTAGIDFNPLGLGLKCNI